MFPAIELFRTNEPVDEGLNRPLVQLRERTDHLHRLVKDLVGSGAGSALKVQAAALGELDPPLVNECVYLEEDGKFYRTETDLLWDNHQRTMLGRDKRAIGILISKASVYEGTVLLYGYWHPEGLSADEILEEGEIFQPGPHYLSFAEAGKLTSFPKGPKVLVGILSGTADSISPVLVTPYAVSDGTAHSHHAVAMVGTAAGYNNAFDDEDETPRNRILGYEPQSYLVGGADQGEVPPFRLRVEGYRASAGAATYTFWIDNSTDDMRSTRVYWSTSDGSDDSYPGYDDPSGVTYDEDYGGTIGVSILAFGVPVAIGSLGVRVVLEPGFDVQLPAPDFETQDFSAVAVDGLDFDARSWERELPLSQQGWLPYQISAVGTYSGPGADPGFTVVAFGQLDNAARLRVQEWELNSQVTGDMEAGTTAFEIIDEDSLIIATFSSIEFGEPFQAKGLWLCIYPYDQTKQPVADTAIAAGDSWTLRLEDPAAGSKFRYNIEADASFGGVYPPRPVSGMVLVGNGVILEPYGVWSEGHGSYEPQPDGLYWRDDRLELVPFPRDQELPEDEVSEEFRILLVAYMTSPSIYGLSHVTSLRPAPGSGVKILRCGTDTPASTGDLEIDARLSISHEQAGVAGYQVLKEVGSGGRLLAGPVVEKIIAGPGILVSPSNPSFPGQGTLRISTADADVLQGSFEELTLLNAKQEMVPGQLFSYVQLLPYDSAQSSNLRSAFVARMRVPQFLTAKYRMVVYATVFGKTGVEVGVNAQDTQYAGITFTYSILPDLVDASDPAAPTYVPRNLAATGAGGVLTSELALANDLPFGKGEAGYTAYDPILFHNDPGLATVEGQVPGAFTEIFPLAEQDPEVLTAGDLVALRFQRAQPAQAAHRTAAFEYTGAVGFINLRWRLVEVEE